MSEPIQSIAQNNYILHNIDAKKLYVQEPLFTANSGDAVYVGWRPDETVLYDSSAKWTGITFSEPASNFERIRLLISTNRPSIFEYPSYAFTNNSWPGGQFGAGWGGKPTMNIFELSANDNGFNVNAGWHTESTASVNWTTLNVSSTWIRPIKVIGINRKENA